MKPQSRYNIVIIGGGPAGLAAAVAAKKAGEESILIIEREAELGGILNQCIHNGFGLHTFGEELTGPEYAQKYIDMVENEGIEYVLSTTVINIDGNKTITAVSRENGLMQIDAKAIVLAMGCRERPRGSLRIPGFNPAGIFSAGTAQKLVNIDGYMPGRTVVILGSGDIGLIMARRMTLEGANVKLVAELMPFSGGLNRNIVQCLNDYNIPLKLSHTVVDIDGKERLRGITLAQVDENLRPIAGTEEYVECDTLLLSVGLIPENELSKQIGVELSGKTNGPLVNERLETNVGGVFACGNVLHVHDLVDYVSEEAEAAGRNAAEYAAGRAGDSRQNEIDIVPEGMVRYTVPVRIDLERADEKTVVRFRVADKIPGGVIHASVEKNGERKEILRRKKRILAPGEMEQILLKKEDILGAERIIISAGTSAGISAGTDEKAGATK